MVELLQFALQLLIYFIIPGALVTAALLRGVKLSLFDKGVLALIIGMLLNPTLSILEFTFLNVKLTGGLVAANALLLTVAGVLSLYLQGAFSQFTPQLPKIELQGVWKNKSLIAKTLLLLLIVSAFYIRLAPGWSTSFFEFDPIYYDHVTEMLVKNGAVPVSSFEVYYPLEKTYRVYPLVIYLTGSWFLQYENLAGGGFDKDALMLIAQIYPPLVGALMCFLAFMLVREEYDEFIGVIAAGVMAFTPNMVVKFGGGVNELQPFGMFAALLLFTIFALAVKRNSARLGLLAGVIAFANVLGSAQAIWPLMIIALFGAIYSVLAFWRNELELKAVGIHAAVVLGGVMGYYALYSYTTVGFQANAQVILLAASLLPTLLLAAPQLATGKHLDKHTKKLALAGLAGLAIIAFIAIPGVAPTVMNFINAAAGFARQTSALTMTVAEENATTPGQYFGAFAYLDPGLLLPLLTFVIIAGSINTLYNHGHKKVIVSLAAIAIITIIFNNTLDSLLLAVTKAFFSQLTYLSQFIAQSDAFIYMLLAVLALAVESVYVTEKKFSYTPLLLALVILPVSYIGLNKLKFLLHLAFALALCLPVILGMLLELANKLSEQHLQKEPDRKFASKAALALLLVIGLWSVYSQATTVDTSMNQLRYSRIPPDWIAAYDWMRTTPTMSDDTCIKEYGFKCRVLSWWDYGHWTTFFGEKYSVLDPGNEHLEFNHETARTFVNGNPENLRYSMATHQATHILVDAELIQKWGALVFLSGTCERKYTPICPATPDVNYSTNEGRGAYEVAHFYENINNVGNCPQGASPVAMPAFQSQLTGAVYCFAEDRYFLLKNTGIDYNYSRKYKIAGREEFNAPEPAYSYLFPVAQGQFLNANPDLSYANANNTYANSTYARLFFFENLPGAQLAYKSPNGQVKIFKANKGLYLNATEKKFYEQTPR